MKKKNKKTIMTWHQSEQQSCIFFFMHEICVWSKRWYSKEVSSNNWYWRKFFFVGWRKRWEILMEKYNLLNELEDLEENINNDSLSMSERFYVKNWIVRFFNKIFIGCEFSESNQTPKLTIENDPILQSQ